MRYLIRTLFSLIFVIAIASVLLPNRYKIEQTITSHCQQKQLHNWVFNLANWHLWNPWTTYQKQRKELELVNSSKVGAYLKWQNGEDIGEMTVTALTSRYMTYTSIIDNHTRTGKIFFSSLNDHTHITWQIEGDINTFLIGGILTQYNKYKAQSAIQHGLRNLNSLCKTQNSE